MSKTVKKVTVERYGADGKLLEKTVTTTEETTSEQNPFRHTSPTVQPWVTPPPRPTWIVNYPI